MTVISVPAWLGFALLLTCINHSEACFSSSGHSSSSSSSHGSRTSNTRPSSSNPGSNSYATGARVVESTVSEIQDSNIFPDDKGLLRKIAWVESKDGRDRNTFREGYHGGIWQVDEAGFRETQAVQRHPGLAAKHKAIKKEFGIDWPSLSYSDIRGDPLKSGLSARLVLSNKPEAIPADNDKQAQYWKTHYNTEAGLGTVQKFKADVAAMEN